MLYKKIIIKKVFIKKSIIKNSVIKKITDPVPCAQLRHIPNIYYLGGNIFLRELQ